MSAKSFFSKVLNKDMDSVICRLIDMPKGVYDQLPGEAGAKFLTTEQYAILRDKGITAFDLSKQVHKGMYAPRRTLVFNDEFMTTISCEKNAINFDTYRPMVSVVIGSYDACGKMGWEDFGVEFGRDDRYHMCAYKSARVRTTLDANEVSARLTDAVNYNGGVKAHNPFKTLISDTKTRLCYDHIEIPNANKPQVYCDSRLYNVDSTLPEIVSDATANGSSVYDHVMTMVGLNLTAEDYTSIM
jgi:hypothetical protein